MFFIIFPILIIFLFIIPGFFVLFQLSSLTFILNNPHLFLSTNSDNSDLIQTINAEDNIKNRNHIEQTTPINKKIPDNDFLVGSWASLNKSLILEHLKEKEQKNAIDILLNQGFSEYYFAMNNFEDPASVKITEELLKSTDKTNLKIIIILRPPSEGGPDTNYDWKGWIRFFNSLEKKYPGSFEGFTIDDFNWISTKNDTKFRNNIDFMDYSNLIKALKDKDKDVKFYPTIYFEGKRTNIVANKYNDFIDGLIVASGCYYNVSTLKKELILFSEIFEKSIRYVVYPTITYNYSRQGYSPPTDRLIMATLSIASNSPVDGLIIWRDIDNPVIQKYLINLDNTQYQSEISKMRDLQIKDEEIMTTSSKTLLNTPNAEHYTNCQGWSIKYNNAYNKWKDLSQEEKEKNKWKKEILQILQKDNKQ